MAGRAELLLAGDVGGTKTNLAVYSREAGLRAPLAEATFPSADFDDLATLVRAFLADVALPVTRACVGVAGPVVNRQARITNLPWLIDEDQLAEALNFSSFLVLNDLVAIAAGVPFLETDDLHTLHVGEPEPGGAKAVIAPGTGLGEAFLTWDGERYRAYASEGGHADFAPNNALEIGLLRYLQERLGHVSYERVCSGIGIPNIYGYLKDSEYAEEASWVAEKLAAADDPTPVIVQEALDGDPPCALCSATLDTFVGILGAEAGNMALRVVATGGVYLGGGIPTRILPALDGDHFRSAFLAKGRLSHLMARTPVYVILNPKSALLGAAAHGFGL